MPVVQHLRQRKPTTNINRRRLMQGAVAALASPFVARQALAQGRTVNIFAWAGYLTDEMLAAFTPAIGIQTNFTPYGTNAELLNQMRANIGGRFDLIWPTVECVPNFVEFGLVQPIDETRVMVDRVLPSAWQNSVNLGAVVDGERYQVPSDCGTEALSFDRTQTPLEYGTASYGDIWREDGGAMATVRGHWSLVGLGLWMDSQGMLPRPLLDTYKTPEAQIEVFDVIVAEAIKRKGNNIQFWSNENEAQGAFRVNGAAIGQTWDSTAAGMAREDLSIGHIAPKEGALAWMEGLSIPSGATNLDEAYEFINWFLTPEAGAMYTNATSINSTAVSADQPLSEEAREFFAAAYPGDALDNLWWWPIQESWYITKCNEFQDCFLSACSSAISGRRMLRSILTERPLSIYVELDGYADRLPGELSGGPRQRVAIARALAVEAALLLLDEPLSALDLKLRQHLRAELRALQKRTGVTFIYITHDQSEALAMSDRVAVMSEGLLQQVADPRTLYSDPKTPFVARFVGETNAVSGQVLSVSDGLARLRTGHGLLSGRAGAGARVGDAATIHIRLEALVAGTAEANRLEAHVERLDFEGAFSLVHGALADGARLIAALPCGRTIPVTGSAMAFHFAPEAALVLGDG